MTKNITPKEVDRLVKKTKPFEGAISYFYNRDEIDSKGCINNTFKHKVFIVYSLN